MSEITEIFILKMKDSSHTGSHDPRSKPIDAKQTGTTHTGSRHTGTKPLDEIRERARQDFTALEGVTSWKTYVTTDKSRPTLYAEIYSFPDQETAKRVTPQFAKRQATQAFLAEIDEVLVGQYFTEHKTNEENTGE